MQYRRNDPRAYLFNIGDPEIMQDKLRQRGVLIDVDNARAVIGFALEPAPEGRRGAIRD